MNFFKSRFFVLISVLYLGTSLINARAGMSEPIIPLPEKASSDNRSKVELGGLLFNDPKLSTNNTISCASCHDLRNGGVDGRSHSVGVNGSIGGINAPTVFNSGFNFRQFWNGRAKTLEEQIDGPVQHPKEMGSNWEGVVAKLKADKNYEEKFKAIYNDGITRENIKNAIASFERALTTPDARFDRFLRGDASAITELEKNGYKHFKSYGCIACHQGMNVGGNMYQTMGVMGNYFTDRGGVISDEDLGRFTITKEEQDKYVFRVPSLRNIELTAPYFHDGSAKTLNEAVNVMAKYQLGRKLSKSEVDSIVAFLKTLTGVPPRDLIERKPASP